jgi:hypothetical protein
MKNCQLKAQAGGSASSEGKTFCPLSPNLPLTLDILYKIIRQSEPKLHFYVAEVTSQLVNWRAIRPSELQDYEPGEVCPGKISPNQTLARVSWCLGGEIARR